MSPSRHLAEPAQPAAADGRRPTEGERRVVKTSEMVALNIVHDIKARNLKNGDRLPLEMAMLQEYRVSWASLREALRLLEVQGLISIKPGPGGGPVVGSVDARQMARTASLYFHLGDMRYGGILHPGAARTDLCPAGCRQSAARPGDAPVPRFPLCPAGRIGLSGRGQSIFTPRCTSWRPTAS